jgi:hypothetical protein
MNYNIDIYGMPNSQAMIKLINELDQINFNEETIAYVKIDKAGNAISEAIQSLQYNKYLFQVGNGQIIVNGKL